MWRNGNRIHFQTTIVENDSKVLTGAYMDLTEVKTAPSVMSNLCSAKHVDSDAIFGQIEEYVKANTEQVKKINGVFHFIITIKGQPEADWVLDLKKGVVYRGKPDGKVDTTLTIDDKDMIQMALGKLNPQMAFMKGKLKVKGNIMLTQKIRTLLEANRPKL